MVFGCTDDECCMSLDSYESTPGGKLSYRCPDAKYRSGACECGACGMDDRTGVCNEIDEFGKTEAPILVAPDKIKPGVCTKQNIGGFDVCWKQELNSEVNCSPQECGLSLSTGDFISTVNGLDLYNITSSSLDQNGNFIPSQKIDLTCINEKFPNFSVCMQNSKVNGNETSESMQKRMLACIEQQEGGINNVLNTCKSECVNKKLGSGQVCSRQSSQIVDCKPSECGIDEKGFVGSHKIAQPMGALGVVNVYDPKASQAHKAQMSARFSARGVGAYRPRPKMQENFQMVKGIKNKKLWWLLLLLLFPIFYYSFYGLGYSRKSKVYYY